MIKQPEQAVILCGGLGTRLRPLTDSMPKPMIPVNDRPFLEHLLNQIAAQGIRRFLLLTGYRGEQIRDYFEDGRAWGWEIDYSHGPVDWETGRRLWEARQQMDLRFLLLYSDNFVQFSMDRLMALHRSEKVSLSLLLAPKTKGNIRVSPEGHIEVYDKTRLNHHLDFVEVGYMIVERDPVLNLFPHLNKHPDFSFSEILQHLASINQLSGLIVRDHYHSISDPDRLDLMRAYLSPQKLLLIDRDGVINQRPPRGEYVRGWEEFKWIPETRHAMRELAVFGFQFIVISNQAGIARGLVDSATVEQIHQNMVAELRKDGIDILRVYVCPHHWDENCDCRKPAPGLFFRASREHLLRMDRTIYIGDDVRDCLAADNAGCPCILVGHDHEGETAVKVNPSLRVETLLEAVPWISEKFQNWMEGSTTKIDAGITQ
ncbi:MAG: HAD-IIIA family hydrolase [Deltaproteobacteria bacterium]|nr:HAD-IIIA family hydrolase [Deltaproteobacteria bacterium]